jgi:hypothetical protein
MMERADTERARREAEAKKSSSGKAKKPTQSKRGSTPPRKPKKQGGKHGA